MLDISTFELERVVFEARFSTAFLHFDRAGRIWTDVRRTWPTLTPSDSTPTQTSCQTDDYQFFAGLEQARLLAYFPERTLEQFGKAAQNFLDIVTHNLEVESYSRVGLRLIYFQKFPDRSSAAESIAGTRLISLPQMPLFNSRGTLAGANYSVRFEGVGMSFHVAVRSESRAYSFKPAPQLRDLPSVQKEHHGVIFDIDCYTVGVVEVGQLGVAEWIQAGLHAVRRDSRNLLGDQR